MSVKKINDQERMTALYGAHPLTQKSTKSKNATVHWDKAVQHIEVISVEMVGPFSARGMQNVYGRGDHFGGRQPVLHLDLWKSKDGRLLVRFWSRGSEVDDESYEVRWKERTDYPPQDERWVPEVVRRAYDNWVIGAMNFG